MENKELLTALECIITKYAQSQFAMNGIGTASARLIMKSVFCNFLEDYVESDTLQRVRIGEPEPAKAETHTGTVEELEKDLANAGFKPD